MKSSRPRATVLYNKAKLGYDIIKSVADFTPGAFEDDKTFSEFIGSVDAFITTQSILQESLVDDIANGDEERQSPPSPDLLRNRSGEAEKVSANGQDEWDF